jgi:hypothetical protein
MSAFIPTVGSRKENRADFSAWPPEARFFPGEASKMAFASSLLSDDVKLEIGKLQSADTLIL